MNVEIKQNQNSTYITQYTYINAYNKCEQMKKASRGNGTKLKLKQQQKCVHTATNIKGKRNGL